MGNCRIGDIVRHVFKTITHALITYNNPFFAKKGSISYFKLSQSNPVRPRGISKHLTNQLEMKQTDKSKIRLEFPQ